MTRFADVLKAFDEKLLTTVAENSADIMGKEMSLTVLREFFRPTMKEPKDPKYSPLMKVKVSPISAATGQMPRVFNKDRSMAELSDISKGCSVKLIIDIPYVYFVNKNFGATVKLFQACITKASNKTVNPDNYVFFDEEDDGEAGSSQVTPGMDFVDDDF